MKPYIMNYSVEHEIKATNFSYCPQKQLNTFPNGENVVSKHISDHTVMSETVEPTDPDEIDMASTVMTKTIEPADPDELLFYSTRMTFTVEPADPDEIEI